MTFLRPHVISLALAIMSCAPIPTTTTSDPEITSVAQATTVADPLTVLHVLTEDGGTTIRGHGAELNGRIYWLAGERGPNGSPNCASTANWNNDEHKAKCPGALISIAMDGDPDFRVDHAFTRLDDRGQNVDGYHPYGSPTAAGDCLVGVTQMGGVPVGAGIEATTARGVGVMWRYCPAIGSFETLHNFFGVEHAFDGMYPMGAPDVLPDGRICGTTKDGGHYNRGTVWCWSPNDFRFVSLHGESYGGVTYADGRLHLTTNNGGRANTGQYLTVDPDTMTVTEVDSFPAFTGVGCCDDNTSIQAPTLLSSGDVVMPRQFAGPYGTGVLVKLNAAGIAVLKSFDTIPRDGCAAAPRFANTTVAMPNGRVTETMTGTIMGVGAYGGAFGAGGIYEILPDTTGFRLLYSFSPDGPSFPYGGLITTRDGRVYGSTFNGGVIFRFDPTGPLCP